MGYSMADRYVMKFYVKGSAHSFPHLLPRHNSATETHLDFSLCPTDPVERRRSYLGERWPVDSYNGNDEIRALRKY